MFLQHRKHFPVAILNKEKQSSEIHIVFDVDETLTSIINGEDLALGPAFDPTPECPVLTCLRTDYLVFPDFEKVFLTIISWGWHVDFFSLGTEQRNSNLVPLYMKHMLRKVVQSCLDSETYTLSNIDVELLYESLRKKSQFRVYSRNHARFVGTGTGYKKDLTVVTKNLNNCILVDDDRANAVEPTQLPFIGVGYRFLRQSTLGMWYGKHVDYGARQVFPETAVREEYKMCPLDTAAYIMGILISCKSLLDSNKAKHLRHALDMVLRHRGRSFSQFGRREFSLTSWFLQPNKELEAMQTTSGLLASQQDEKRTFMASMKKWIALGKQHFEHGMHTCVEQVLRDCEVLS